MEGNMRRYSLWVLVLVLLAAGHLTAQELTLYTMPPPRDLNWKNPQTLAFGAALGNRLVLTHVKHKHTFGHVFIELKGEGYHELTGSTTAPDAPADAEMITKHGHGLGVFFAPLKGALDPKEGLEKELVDRYKSGRVAYIRFKLSPSTFERLQTFLKEYKERGYNQIYNGTNEPRKGKGAGCSIFGVVFLELAGLLHPVWVKEWVRERLIPLEFIGGPLTGKRVSLKQTLVNSRWAKPSEPHMVLRLYDPELMYKWIGLTWKNLQHESLHANPAGKGSTPAAGKATIEKRGNALGLVYDCRHVPTPTDPIWQNP
jgi:hypothetical protein